MTIETTANDWQESDFHIEPIEYEINEAAITDFESYPLIKPEAAQFDFEAFKHYPIKQETK